MSDSLSNNGLVVCCSSVFAVAGQRTARSSHNAPRYHHGMHVGNSNDFNNLFGSQASPDDKPRNHHCSYCGRNFYNKSHLTQHIRNIHEKVQHVCTQCGKTYSSYGSLHNHIKIIHSKRVGQNPEIELHSLPESTESNVMPT